MRYIKYIDSKALKIHYSDLYCDNSRGQSSGVTHLSTKHFPKLTSKAISKETSITKGISSKHRKLRMTINQ
jgi:hypothetical protein